MDQIIYGVDTNKKITPAKVRDAVIKCFAHAHDEIFQKLREYGEIKDNRELQKLKNLNAEMIVKHKFEEIGGNFSKPSKQDIIRVCDALAEFASNFRQPEIIKKHYGEIMTLVNKMEE